MTMDATPILKKMADLQTLLMDHAESMLRQATKSFIYAAVKFTPPKAAIGRNIIPKAFYNRHVETLADLKARNELTKYDVYAMQKGMKYKVFKRSEGSKTKSTYAYAYTRTAKEANDAKKIANRGLARWSWGSDAPADIRPKSMAQLVTKSPHLAKYNFNKVTISKDADGRYFSVITNFSKNAGAYCNFAARKAEDNAARFLWKSTKGLRDIELATWIRNEGRDLYRSGLQYYMDNNL